jgi:predicted double-glycine peptidase
VKQTNRKIIKDGTIKIWLPEVQQKTHFSCAAAVVHSICAYYGLGLDSHYDYFPYLETDESYGTLPEKIVGYFKSVGLSCKLKHNMTVIDICSELDLGKPVILAIQAYGNAKKYHKSGNGHYVVAIGYDSQNMYFEDPMLNCSRGYIPKSELKKRWHDIDYKGVDRNQLGIIVWHNKKPFYINRAKKIP